MRNYLTLLIIVLALTACSGEEDSSSAVGAAVSSRPTPTATTSQNLDLAGMLIYIEDDNLYLQTFDDQQPPVLIASDVVPGVFTAPDSTSVIYSTPGTVEGHIKRYDINAATHTTLISAQGWQARSLQLREVRWSPNREWIILSTHGQDFIVDPTGTIQQPIQRSSIVRTLWLTDNTALNYTIDNGQVISLTQHDPAAGTRTELDDVEPFDFRYDRASWETLRAILDQYGLEIAGWPPYSTEAPPFQIQPPPDYNGHSLRICDTWRVLADNDVVYEVDNVALVAYQRTLGDGSGLLMQWRYADCEFSGLSAQLVHLQPGQSPTIIADSIYPGSSNDARFAATDSSLVFAVSADERHVVWLSNYRVPRVNVTDLETSATTVLYEASGMLMSVIWIN